MKKMIISTLFFLSIAGVATAQSSGRNQGKKVSTTSHKAKKPVQKKTSTSKKPAKTVELDNTKEYMKDGQLATPTGHEATPVNSDQYQSLPDSSAKKRWKQ